MKTYSPYNALAAPTADEHGEKGPEESQIKEMLPE